MELQNGYVPTQKCRLYKINIYENIHTENKIKRLLQTCQSWENFLSTTVLAPLADSHFPAGGERSVRAVTLVQGAATEDCQGARSKSNNWSLFF